MFATRKRPFLSTVIYRKSTFREGLHNIITPSLCLKQCANRISAPHSARHTSSKLGSPQVSCKKIISNLLRWNYRKCFLRLIDLLRPLIFSETALRQVHVFLISLRIHFRVYYDVFHTYKPGGFSWASSP